MSVKHEVLKILEERRGESVSGEALAVDLGASRTAVWKAVGALKDEGYPIDGAPKRGYTLSESSSVLSREAIAALSPMDERLISVYREIDSTNAEAKRRIADASTPAAIPYGSVILADRQELGRGRRGRSFFSPAAGSIYVSFILKPYAAIEHSLPVTIMAAAAVCRAIETVCDDAQRPQIKWVNDIFLGGKKICGILTEAVSDVESGSIESLVLGIGVNINVPESAFPEELRGIAGSLTLESGKRGVFAATLIGEVFSLYETLTASESDAALIIEEYRARSMMMGRAVTVIKNAEPHAAVSRGIADDGSLIVEYPGGAAERLRFGEVSITL
jgi:BirA family biotin operon repressor/biotin-[acetyl-CoA-carboxylase] ligase